MSIIDQVFLNHHTMSPSAYLSAILHGIKDIQNQLTTLKDGQSSLEVGRRRFVESQRRHKRLIDRVLKRFESFDKQIQRIPTDHKDAQR